MEKETKPVKGRSEYCVDTFMEHDNNLYRHRKNCFNRLKAASGVCYLDNAGSSLYSESQVRAYSSLLCSNVYGNPHSGNQSSKLSADVTEQVRTRVLQFFNTTSDEYSVIFTSGATASLKLLAESFVFGEVKPVKTPSLLKKDIEEHGSNVDTGLPESNSNTGLPESNGNRGLSESNACIDLSESKSNIGLSEINGTYSSSNSRTGGTFYYTEDNHTSVVGMRQLVQQRGFKTKCINHENVVKKLFRNNINTKNKAFKLCCACKLSDCCNSNTVCFSHHNRNIISRTKCKAQFMNSRNNLFVYPAQSNFNGLKYPLEWIEECQYGRLICNCGCFAWKSDENYPAKACTIEEKCADINAVYHCETCTQENGFCPHIGVNDNWFVGLDAASYVSTSPLDLRENQPDFVVLSFYKIFGFPTGLGALIIKNSSAGVLRRSYFGGGTVNVSVAREDFHVPRDGLSDRFEDGTIAFLDILALNCGFDSLQSIAGSMSDINLHTYQLARFVYKELVAMKHSNGSPVAKLYHGNQFDDITTQGPIICFNVLRSDGSFVGYTQVDKLAQADDIHLRTGCFCNMGACQVYLGISTQTIKENYQAGHVCGDDIDLINGQPTGAIRISFGYYSTTRDALVFLNFISNCFLESVIKAEQRESSCGNCVTKKYLKDGERIIREYFLGVNGQINEYTSSCDAKLENANSEENNSKTSIKEENDFSKDLPVVDEQIGQGRNKCDTKACDFKSRNNSEIETASQKEEFNRNANEATINKNLSEKWNCEVKSSSLKSGHEIIGGVCKPGFNEFSDNVTHTDEQGRVFCHKNVKLKNAESHNKHECFSNPVLNKDSKELDCFKSSDNFRESSQVLIESPYNIESLNNTPFSNHIESSNAVLESSKNIDSSSDTMESSYADLESSKMNLQSSNNIDSSSDIMESSNAVLESSDNRLENLRHREHDCLTNIYLYPVKSCGAFEVPEWEISPRGLLYDREWMIVTDAGICLNQKRETKLCLIRPALELKQGTLILTATGHTSISVSLHCHDDTSIVEGSLCTSKVCGDRVSGSDCGDEVAAWLCQVLDRQGVRLIRQSQQHVRRNKRSSKGGSSPDKQLSLANEAQYLLINRASCQALIDHHSKLEQQDIGSLENIVSRFRANFVVSTGTAFEEEEWKSVTVGEHQFMIQGLCNRCQMICVDQDTGYKSKQPLLTLTQIRNRKMTFGILLNHEGYTDDSTDWVKVRVGDKIHVKC